MRPAPALIGALSAWALAGLAESFGWLTPAQWWAGGAALATLAALDAAALRRLVAPGIERRLPAAVPVGVDLEVSLHLHNAGPTPLALEVFDGVPVTWVVRDLPQRVRLPAGGRAELRYRVRPEQRGDAAVSGCDVRLRSPWRLWAQRRLIPPAQPVRVFPNFAPLARLALLGAERATQVVGAHVHRWRGDGTEFHQLREYRVGDSLRQIDWKASQRTRKLISRDYQAERSQQVILMLDTGRRLLAHDDALSHFDHVLNASLVVSYLALRQGDAVGLQANGGPSRWLPPRRGMAAIDALINEVYDLHAEPVATDYLAAATQLAVRQHRRALVMLVTNVRDEDSEDLLAAVRLLQRRHLVCVASLREQVLDRGMDGPVADFDAAIRVGGLARYLQERERAHRALRAHGVTALDVTCAELPAALVQRYLAVKRSGQL